MYYCLMERLVGIIYYFTLLVSSYLLHTRFYCCVISIQSVFGGRTLYELSLFHILSLTLYLTCSFVSCLVLVQHVVVCVCCHCKEILSVCVLSKDPTRCVLWYLWICTKKDFVSRA